MYHNLTNRRIAKKNGGISFIWQQPLPRAVDAKSSFVFKLAQACLFRKLVFRESIIEEKVGRVYSTRISPTSIVVKFWISTFQQIADNNLGFDLYDQVYVTVLCNHLPKSQEVKVQVLHAESLSGLKQIVRKKGLPTNFNFSYRYEPLRFGDERFQIRIVGFLRIGLIFSSPQSVIYSQFPFIDKTCLLAFDPERSLTKRLR